MDLPDGLVAVVKRDCPTCQLAAPVLAELHRAGVPLTVFSQDDPSFPEGLPVRDDTPLEISYRLGIDIVPTLIRVSDGQPRQRIEGWHRGEWRALSGIADLGSALPEQRPGCGSLTVEPAIAERLAAQFGADRLAARRVTIGDDEDDAEACYARGWSDGLPVVAPTPERVLRMLSGTTRAPSEIVAIVPPDLAECTVEKVAINAVLAGCKPEYLPVVLAAVEAACTDDFNIHGVLATTHFVGPVVIVNGPLARDIDMNWGLNALGQGNRANATIGRALQLVIRNVGGGRPGGVDRATLGNPGKYTFCSAEDEVGSPWESLAVERGLAAGRSAVTLFAGEGVQGIVDQKSRTPESLAKSFALCLRAVDHPKLAMAGDAVLVVSPEHSRVFIEAGWSKARLLDELTALLTFDADAMLAGAGGIAEGLPAALAGKKVTKFRPGGLLIVRAGGSAGLFSA
ncbi:MAG TPA: thioredoxin family protein, partial [Chloroflexota bacterium]